MNRFSREALWSAVAPATAFNRVQVSGDRACTGIARATFRSSAFSPTLFVGEKVPKADEGALPNRLSRSWR
jgi:hypothetical protein